MKRLAKKIGWIGVALCLTFITLVGLGTLAEDSQTTAAILAHFAGKSLILIFAFFAAKIPLLYLIEGIVLSGGTSTLMWHKTLNLKSRALSEITSLQPQICPEPTTLSSTHYIKQKLNVFEPL